MSTDRSEYTVTVKVSSNTGGEYSSSAELEGSHWSLSYHTREAIADALEELAESLRNQGDD
jgi:hypothetical protein